MNKLYTVICKALSLSCIALLPFLSSCKKVDEHTQFINNQPAFAISEDGVTVPSLNIYGWKYPTVLITGDTATLIGRFFLNQPGLQLKIGNVLAPLVFKQNTPAGPQTGAQPYDVIRFVVTKEMGNGANIPVKLTANNITIAGPFVTIQAFAGAPGQTDTTLWVDKVLNWRPDNIAQYQNLNLPLVVSSCVDASGNIYFTNAFGVFAIKNGKVQQYLKTGDKFTESGISFSIRTVIGSVTSFDGSTLTFSAAVSENSTDTLNNYVFRLCKLPVGSMNAITINRTLVKKGIGVNAENPTPYEGASGKVKLVAINLKTDVNQNIYFRNQFSPEAPGIDNDAWFGGISSGVINIFDTHSLLNICLVNPTGQLTSLFYQNFSSLPSDFIPPGYRVDWSTDYLVSLDGNTAAVMTDFSNFSTPGITMFDLKKNEPLATLVAHQDFKFQSFDNNPTTKRVYTDISANIFMDNNTVTILQAGIFANGNLFAVQSNSILAMNWQSLTSYCFAGTEAGLAGPPPSQSKTTGKAKYVLFPDGILYNGIDRQGSIYYYVNGGPGTSDYVNGVSFYKLYSKK